MLLIFLHHFLKFFLMKNTFFVLFCFTLCTSTLGAQNLITNKSGSSISFVIQNMGMNVDGHFSDFRMKASFDENDLSSSYFSGTAMIKSIDTGVNARNNSLQEKKYFDSAAYPEITLTSDKITKVSGSKYEFSGKLGIKGKTKSIKFPITVEKTTKGIVAKGKFEINRLDYEIGKSSWVMKDKVKVTIVYTGNFK